ncbi:MAG: NADH-quinone oxidoreductase subunit N [Caldisericaceae bacterium]|nr:NADH-quinone oxidoreductase subunit N [Caldisericaceae bacterium]
MDNLSSLSYFVPELFLSAAILVVIVLDLLLKKEQKIWTGIVSAAVLVISVFLIFQQYTMPASEIFRGMLVLDSMAAFIKLIAAVSSLIIILFSLPYFDDKSEYYVLILITTLGMFLMGAVNDILMIIIAMELVGLMSYVLTGFTKRNIKSNEASLKYILYAATSTGVMAFGFSYLYGLTGETNLIKIQQALMTNPPHQVAYFITLILILAGIGYKVAMVPFHFWLPDVYEGAPTTITAFFSIGPKAAGMAVLIRFFTTVVAHGSSQAAAFLQNLQVNTPQLLAVLAVLTMTFGNVVALRQTNIKRLMAYSSIAHAGYMLMAMVVFSPQGYKAVLFYLVVYMFMNFGAFWVIITISQKLGSEEIDAFRGLGYRSPYAAVAMAVFLFSLTGLPPLAGFIGKFYLFAAVVQGGWYVLAVLGVLNSVISLYYYAYIVKQMFLRTVEEQTPVPINLYEGVVLTMLLVPTLLFGVYWSPLLRITEISFNLLY